MKNSRVGKLRTLAQIAAQSDQRDRAGHRRGSEKTGVLGKDAAWQRCVVAAGLSAEDFTAQLAQPFRRALRLHPRRGPLSPAWQDVVAVPWSAAQELPASLNPVRGFFHADQEDPAAFLDYHTGCIYPQDAASQLPVRLLAAQAGECILDSCAAPGSKTTALALDLADTGLVIAADASPARRKIIRENVSRQGVINVVVTRSSLEELASAQLAVDAALVDAPCSGHVYRSTKQVQKMGRKQLRILEQAAACVRPGGRLVYSTCTMYFEENEAVIETFLQAHDDWMIDPVAVTELGLEQSEAITDTISPTLTAQGSVRIWPSLLGTEPFFACRLRRRGESLPALEQMHGTGHLMARATSIESINPDLGFSVPDGLQCIRHKQFILLCNQQSAAIDVAIQSRGMLLAEEIDGQFKLNIWAVQALIERGLTAETVSHSDACALWRGESLGASNESRFLQTEYGSPLGFTKTKEFRLQLPSRAFRKVC